MAKEKEKQIAFYMTQRSVRELDEIQQIFAEREGRVTKAYILNQAIYNYYEYIKNYYGISEETEKPDDK
ncbi:hypothetical protein [Lysinibacillus capsici]|uniref:hypothetical protein n=1 Tax=Lysinibacillus capsici TaxID=2115968 RepID=UPI002FDCB8ED